MSTPQELAQIASVNPSGTIKTSVSIYLPILGVSFLVFEGVRRKFRRAYESRGTDGNVFWDYATLARLEKTFGWVAIVARTTDDEIFERCGLDALCYLRFLRLGRKVALLVVASSVVLFPLYATATPPTAVRKDVDWLETITMSNLALSDWRLWASMSVGYAVALFTLYLLLLEYQHYARRRHEFMAKLEATSYTVLVNDLPLKLRTRQTLEQYMHKVFPNTIHSVYVAVECKRLEELVEEREEARNAVEHALALMEKKGGVRPTHRVGGSWTGMLMCTAGSRGQKVDSIDFYQERLAKLNEMVAREINSIEEAQAQLAREVVAEEHGDVGPPPTMPPAEERRLAERLEEQAQQQLHEPRRSSSAPKHAVLHRASGIFIDDAEEDDEEEDAVQGENAPGLEEGQEIRDRSRRLHPIRVMRRAAFISFTSLRSAQVSQQAVQNNNPVTMATEPAPHVDDVNWSNVGHQYRTRSMGRLIAAALTATIVIFWTIPTAFVTSLASVESLRRMLPFLNNAFDKHPFLIEIFKQLSPLTLVILNALAPVIFELISEREGYVSTTQVRASMFTKLAYFQLIQIFFVIVIVGTVLDSLKVILDQPKTLISMLGRSMPQQSTFFMSYVIVRTGLSLPIELLRVVPLLLATLFKCLAPQLTRRERRAKWYGLSAMGTTDAFDPATQLADAFLVMLVTLTFAAIAPLVCYFTAFFFFVAELVYRRQVLFVYRAATHSMGAYWPRLYSFLIIALVVAQLTLLGLLTLKKGVIPSTFIIILIVLILLFNHYVSRLFPRVAQYLPLTDCVHLDELRSASGVEEDPQRTFAFLNDVYRQPAMSQRRPLRVDYQMLEEEGDQNGGERAGIASSPEMHAEDQHLFASNSPF